MSELGADVCAHPYATGLDEETTRDLLAGAGGVILDQILAAPRVSREPKVRSVFRKRT